MKDDLSREPMERLRQRIALLTPSAPEYLEALREIERREEAERRESRRYQKAVLWICGLTLAVTVIMSIFTVGQYVGLW